MTQASGTQANSGNFASRKDASARTLPQRRFDLERQIRQAIESDPRMALTNPDHVRERMKLLRKRAGLKQYQVAAAINEPPRTFQSWENAEVETDRPNYEKVARFYSRKLGEKISANWILFGQEEPPAIVLPEASANGDGPLASPQMQEQLDEINRKLDELLRRTAPTAPAQPETQPAGDDGIPTDLPDEQDSRQVPPAEDEDDSAAAG